MTPTAARAFTFVVLLTLAATPVFSGVVMQFSSSGGGSSTQGTASIGADRLRIEQDGRIVVFRGDKGLLWIIEPDEGRYTEMTKEDMSAVGQQVSTAMTELQQQLENLPADQRATIEKMMAEYMPKGDKPAAIAYVKAGKSETINGYPCELYNGSRGDLLVQEAWVTDWKRVGVTARDFKVLDTFSSFIESALGPLANQLTTPFARKYSDKPVADALPGLPIRIVNHDKKAGTITAEVSKVERADLPAERFELPGGLKKQSIEGFSRDPADAR